MAALDPCPAPDFHCVFIQEPRVTVQRHNALFIETALDPAGHLVGEAALERDQFAPVDPQVVVLDPLAAHQPRIVDDLRTPAKQLLGIATPQRAGTAIREFVDDGDRPAGRRAFIRRTHRRHPDAEHDQVERLRQDTVFP